MSSESSQPESLRPELPPPDANEPLDAIVIDVHPALAPPPNPVGVNPFGNLRQEPWPFQQPPRAQYVVPQRFGMSAILGIITALAILFGCLRFLNAYPVVYLFLGILTLVICFVQMSFGKTPRGASAMAGAILLPVFSIVTSCFLEHVEPGAVLCSLVMGVPVGAFVGYLTGTCAAGIFLVMDALEPYLQGRSSVTPRSSTHSPST